MKITFVSIDDYGYNDFIPIELKAKGIEVTHINLHKHLYKYPNIFYKIFNFFSKNIFNYNLKRIHLEKYILQELNKIEFQDSILIARADLFTISTLIKVKKHTKQLLANFNDHADKFTQIKKIYPYFDKVFSFEKKDVKKYGFTFIPNFIYIKNPTIRAKKIKAKYEVFSVSRLDRRVNSYDKIAKVLNSLKISNRIIVVGNNKFRKNKISNLEHSTSHIAIEEVQHLIVNSNVMLDIYRSNQTGLSFRVFESITYKKKLITNNKDIVNYDFYNPNNILVINKDASNLTKEFFDTEYQEIKEETYNYYKLENWIVKVFDL